jgi:hypothetical protein
MSGHMVLDDFSLVEHDDLDAGLGEDPLDQVFQIAWRCDTRSPCSSAEHHTHLEVVIPSPLPVSKVVVFSPTLTVVSQRQLGCPGRQAPRSPLLPGRPVGWDSLPRACR